MTGLPSDAALGALLAAARRVAVIGASPNPSRPSHEVMAFLQSRGLRCFPINPKAVGMHILGEAVAGRLAELPGPVDIADVFRNSDVAGAAVDEAIAEAKRLSLRCIWLQLGVRDDEAMMRAARTGLIAMQDRCLAIDYARLIPL
ncbi:MAG: CoA-binding protein [Rhodospirillales bacterium]|nr:CoA-binding protein [Rhodospirillales bacterium]